MSASFIPPKRTLMGPGPSDVPERVLAALARPTIGHLDPAFITMMDEVKSLLQFAFCTNNALTLPVSAPGSAGMETCFVNLVGPDDTVIVAQNGVFGGRMRENVERCGARAVLIEDEWGQPVDPQKVEDALRNHPEATCLAFVHARNINRCAIRCTGAVRTCYATRLPVHRRCRYFTRWHRSRCRWMGCRCRIFRHSKMPVMRTGHLAGNVW